MAQTLLGSLTQKQNAVNAGLHGQSETRDTYQAEGVGETRSVL
jgi:hypothetical protein